MASWSECSRLWSFKNALSWEADDSLKFLTELQTGLVNPGPGKFWGITDFNFSFCVIAWTLTKRGEQVYRHAQTFTFKLLQVNCLSGSYFGSTLFKCKILTLYSIKKFYVNFYNEKSVFKLFLRGYMGCLEAHGGFPEDLCHLTRKPHGFLISPSLSVLVGWLCVPPTSHPHCDSKLVMLSFLAGIEQLNWTTCFPNSVAIGGIHQGWDLVSLLTCLRETLAVYPSDACHIPLCSAQTLDLLTGGTVKPMSWHPYSFPLFNWKQRPVKRKLGRIHCKAEN